MDDRDLAPGTVLLGKYRVDENLGTGGMGRVIRASHLYLQQSVAIKILLPEMTESPSTVARFLREAQAAVRLKSEHTARVIDVGTLPDGTPFMIMEYLEGNDLNQILRHHGPQQPAIVVDLVLQACEGLAEAHALGIIHRDIKPSNFFITRRPDGSMLLKILDFGISKTPVAIDHELTGTQTVIGTPSYMAPEQMKSGRSADARSDIWSLGVVMYQLLQGRPPFTGETYAELVLQVNTEAPGPILVPLPPGLSDIILRCLEKSPLARHRDVGELARVLAPYATDPIAAAQAATRTMRILQTRASQAALPSLYGAPGQQALPVAAGGGLAHPIPLSPAQLTPRSWPPSTSLSQGRGEMTARAGGGGKAWWIAGALAIAIAAGVGGYTLSALLREGGDEPATAASAATEPAAPPSSTADATPAASATTPTPSAITSSATNATAASATTATPPSTTAPPSTPSTTSTTPSSTTAPPSTPSTTSTTPSSTTVPPSTPSTTSTAPSSTTAPPSTPSTTATPSAVATTPPTTATSPAVPATPPVTPTTSATTTPSPPPPKPATASIAKTATAKPTTTKAATAKPTKTATATPKATAKKPPPKKPTKPPKKPPTDLFNSRH